MTTRRIVEAARGNFTSRRLFADWGIEPPLSSTMRRSVPRFLPCLLALAIAGLCAGASTAAAAAPQPRVVVRFAPGTTATERAGAAHAAGATTPRHIVGATWAVRAHGSVDAAIDRLSASSAVVSVTPELRARAAAFVPNDTGLAANGGPAGGWATEQWDLVGPFGINAPGAWDAAIARGTAGGRGVRVAVVDTGVAYANRGRLRRSPDLAPQRLLRGHDFVDNDNFPNDENGHGTFVASTVAASANNAYGMVGVAYGASILPVRVLDSFGEAGSSRIAQGIVYAVNRGAKVINASIELTSPTAFPERALSITAAPEIREAIVYAHSQGSVVVVASGNLGQADVPSRRLDGDIVYVGGTTEHGCLGDYSNFGPGLDVVAPGGGDDALLTTDPSCRPDLPAGRNVAEVTFRRSAPARFLVPGDYHGTSMAAPHVSGVIALMLGARVLGADPSPERIQARLKATARDLGAPGRDRYYGSGLVDATAALTAPVTTSSG
jgi:serine protease